MVDFFRDPIWQFLGVISGALLAIISIAITVNLTKSQSNKKILLYEILASTPLLALNQEIKDKIQIIYLGKNIENIHLVVIRLSNSGNTPISTKEYESPILFSFGHGTEIISVEIIETNPKSLKPDLQIQNNQVEFKPLLLNPKEYVAFKFLVTKFNGEIDVNARIIGLSAINRMINIPTQGISDQLFQLSLFIPFVAILGAIATAIVTTIPKSSGHALGLLISMMLIGLVTMTLQALLVRYLIKKSPSPAIKNTG
jgi:hypothetical protein